MKFKLFVIGTVVVLFNNQIAQLLKVGCSFIYQAAAIVEKLPEVL